MSNSDAWLWVALSAVSACACSKDAASSDKAETAAPSVTPPVQPPPPAVSTRPAPPADAAPTEAELLLATTSLPDAVERVKPRMTDTDDETSVGAVLLAMWSLRNLKWSDVGVPKNETSFALVHKDSDAARGKRMCFGSTVIQIAKEKVDGGALFEGLLLAGNQQLARYIAVGSTGDLVERSDARFCGVVIGTYDYSNSGGGKGHAVSLVGMFDLPENRRGR